METIKGFCDYTGEEAIKREKVRKIIEDAFSLYGFEPAETPIIESEEFVRGENSQDDAVSDVFKLQDKGRRKLALRYEMTFPLKRISQNKKLPYKRYTIGPVFRDEPVSSNRFRQFTQCDVDIIGSTLKDDAEILALTRNVLEKLGVKFEIYFNSRKLMNEILDKEGVKDKEKAIRDIDKMDKLPESEIKKNLKKYKAEKVLEVFKKPEKFFEKYSAYNEINQLKEICEFYGFKIKFLPTLARGLSYYNGSIFEVKTPEIKETICGGGSYFVNGIQSTGISFGLDRLTKLAKLKLENKTILIISINQDNGAIKLAEKLRKRNVPAVVLDKGISKALDYANSYKIEKVIFIGEDEIKKKKFKLKDMVSGKEEFLSEKELIEKLI